MNTQGTMNRRGILTAAAGGLALLMARPVLAAGTPKVLNIWPNQPPGGDAKVTVQEKITDNREKPDQPNKFVYGVRTPDLTLRYPEKPNGAAVLVLPGGAYTKVVLDKEGNEIAAWLTGEGYVTGVLKYRLPGDGWAAGLDTPGQDALRALRLLRKVSGVNKVGVMGFSAGGHLAAVLGTRYADPLYDRIDATDDLSARPDFMALLYPALGLRALPGNMCYPVFDRVNAQTPPAFIAQAADDKRVTPNNSLEMEARLVAAGVPAELHMFEAGGHGFALRTSPGDVWPGLFDTWEKTLIAPSKA
ncbi:MAG TPA: alpha/beta hydrolase [Asticcacaulis sp.]|nr:alpha/beta hydrolase [Asticcacaulis sp.]